MLTSVVDVFLEWLVVEVPAQLIAIVIMKALDGGVLDGAFHPLDLAVRPGMLHLGKTMFDAVLIAEPIEDVMRGICVTGSIGELDASPSASIAPSGSLDYFVLLDGLPLSSWRCRVESVPWCLSPSRRRQCTIKARDQTLRSNRPLYFRAFFARSALSIASIGSRT